MICEITNSRSITRVGAQIAEIRGDTPGRIEGDKNSLEGNMAAPPENLKIEQMPKKSTPSHVDLSGEVSQEGQEKCTPDS